MERHGAMLAAIAVCCAAVQPAVAQRPDAELVRRAAERFVARETGGLPGRVTYTIGALDPQLTLPACRTAEVFLPPGGRLWGHSTLGVRCTAPTPWTVYLPAEVQVWAGVVHSARAITQGQAIQEADLGVHEADLTRLPAGVVTDVRVATGKALVSSLPPGQPLRADLLRAPTVIQQGQPVKLLVRGRGYTVSGEGRALTAASEGQLVQVRVQSGLVVSGLARAGATVEMRP